MADDRITRFVDLHQETEELLNQSKVKEAKQKYLDVVQAYQAIHNSDLEKFHKDIAYQQITTLFKQVSQAKERIKVPVNLIVAACLIIAFSITIAFKPSIVGLASFEDTITQPIGKTFTESGVEQFTLQELPLSLSATGTVNGSAKLFLKQGEKLELIYDSEKSPTQNGAFTRICEETCDVNLKSNAIELFIQVDEGSITLDELVYDIERTNNNPPTWKSKKRIFNAKQGQPLTIDLDKHFTDKDGDKLTYLSTTDDGLDVNVQNNLVTITPERTGSKHVVLVASDLIDLTRVTVTIEVK